MSPEGGACAATQLAGLVRPALRKSCVEKAQHAPESAPDGATFCIARAAGQTAPASVTPIISRNAPCAIFSACEGTVALVTNLENVAIAVMKNLFAQSDRRQSAFIRGKLLLFGRR